MSALTKPFCRLKVFGTRWARHDPTTVTGEKTSKRGLPVIKTDAMGFKQRRRGA